MTARYPYEQIVIPVDFSDASAKSLAHGMKIARENGAAVTAVFVVDMSFPYPDLFSFEDPNQDYFKVMRDKARARINEWLAEIPESQGVEVETVVGHGRPAVEIVEIAEHVGADLVVVSRQDQSGLRHALMGSTTEAVVRSAACPVLVLPIAERTAREGD